MTAAKPSEADILKGYPPPPPGFVPDGGFLRLSPIFPLPRAPENDIIYY